MNNHIQLKTCSGTNLGILSCLFAVLASGCQQYAKITWEVPEALPVGKRTLLATGELAKLSRKGKLSDANPSDATIGKHTFTVFAIPAGNINAHQTTPLQPSFESAIRDALTAAGYELVDALSAPRDTPVLRGELNECWWWSYSWFWPLMVQGGQNKVTLFLENRDGTVLWKRSFSRIEPGLALGGSYGIDLMIKWSMTKLLKDIVRECSSEEFKAALRQA